MSRCGFTGGPRRFPASAAGSPMRPFCRESGGASAFVSAEGLEARVLLATFTVTTTEDAGPGSLRQALIDSAVGEFTPDTIVFAIPGAAGEVRTIRPMSALPRDSQNVTVDGTTQPGYAGSPLIELDGSLAGHAADGLVVDARSVVRRLVINRFGRHGIHVIRPEVRVEGNYLGTTADGAASAGNGGAGVWITDFSTNRGRWRNDRRATQRHFWQRRRRGVGRSGGQ